VGVLIPIAAIGLGAVKSAVGAAHQIINAFAGLNDGDAKAGGADGVINRDVNAMMV